MFLEIIAVVGVIAANFICYAFHDKSLIRYKLGGPKLLLISNRSTAFTDDLPKDYWAISVLDPEHLVTSLFLNEVLVLLLRVFYLAFFAITLLLEGLTGDGFGNPGFWFTFFTNWTFLLFGLWSVLGIALTAHSIQSKLSVSTIKQSQSQIEDSDVLTSGDDLVDLPFTLRSKRSKWGIASVTYLFMTEITASSTLFLSFFYWTFLFSPKAPLQIDNLLKHGVNNVVLLLEALLCRTPFVSYHYQAVLLYGTVYTLFMWIYHAASLHWVYWVLDWSKPTAIGLYLLNPIFLCAAFFFWYCVAWLREKLGSLVSRSSGMTALRQSEPH